MYVTTKEMLKAAQSGGYAVGAFNFENMEMAMAIVKTAEELRAPVILQTTPSTVKYASLEIFCGIAKALAENHDEGQIPYRICQY
jgi:tagatose 1,6-diphosphate aldolase GatY/KbaY